MRKILALLLSLVFGISLVSCAIETEESSSSDSSSDVVIDIPTKETKDDVKDITSENKILVVCFSRTGNTKTLAEYAASYYEAPLFEIEAKEPYTDEDIDYNNSSSRTSKEQNDKSARPLIANEVQNINQYDIIILAYPIWWGQAPRIIDTFLESYDFSGKTIVPFCTSASSPIGSSDTNLHEDVSEDVKWIAGKRFSAGSSKDSLISWLEESGITK